REPFICGAIGPTLEQRIGLVCSAVFAFLGAVSWMFERPPAGRTLQALTALSIFGTLVYLQRFYGPDIGRNEAGGYSRIQSPSLAFQTGSDSTAAALLGSAMTAMLVGHSYLISPGLTIKPLMRQLAFLGVAGLLRVAVAGIALWFWTA